MIRLALPLLLTVCFTLATWLEPQFQQRNNQTGTAPSVFAVLMGDSRRMFATHFFEKADATFHGGLAPSIFDAPMKEGTSHMTEEIHTDPTQTNKTDHHEEELPSFFQPPKDWIEAFGRNFFPVTHIHISDTGQEREILPWIKLASELDPQRIAPYITAAYWLRTRMGKPAEAEAFLREGLRNNPDSYEILLELGRIYRDNKKELPVAENLLELSLKKWHKQEAAGMNPSEPVYRDTLGELVRLEEQQGNFKQMIIYLEEMKKISPNPDVVEKQIQDVKKKMSTSDN